MGGRNRIAVPLMVLTDAVAVSLAIRLGFLVRLQTAGLAHFAPHRQAFLALLPVSLVVYWLSKMYDVDSNRSFPDILHNAFLGTLCGCVATVVPLFSHQLYNKTGVPEMSRIALALWWVLAFALTSGWRMALISVLKWKKLFLTRVLLVCENEDSVAIADEIEKYSRTGHRVMGIVKNSSPLEHTSIPVLGTLDSLPEIVRREQIDEIIVASADASREEAMKMLLAAEQTEARVRVLPSLYEMLIGNFDLVEVAGVPLVEVQSRFLTGGYRYVKRLVDIAGATVGLACSLPLLVIIAVAIKLDSPGPVLFKQQRVGRNKRPFTICKFRSMKMHHEPEDKLTLATEEDPRITKVGRFIRKRRLDEIPQLINVLKGDMSLVGPRPPQVGEASDLRQKMPLYDKRFSVRPGLTCLSHTQGRYDSTPKDRARYDLVYLKSISFFLDLRIMLDTVKVVLTGKGSM